MTNRNFLGTGWSFPPSFNQKTGKVEMTSSEINIRENIIAILSTLPGERVMREDFGCDLLRFAFGEVDQHLISGLQNAVSNSLLEQEPRIRVERIEVTEVPTEPGLLHILITFFIRATNSRSNLVYPFYLQEAYLP